jgi:hypothetical protein
MAGTAPSDPARAGDADSAGAVPDDLVDPVAAAELSAWAARFDLAPDAAFDGQARVSAAKQTAAASDARRASVSTREGRDMVRLLEGVPERCVRRIRPD